jgi:hypothetical protein
MEALRGEGVLPPGDEDVIEMLAGQEAEVATALDS